MCLPLASKLYKDSLDEFRSLYHRSIKVVVLIALPISAGVWLIAPDLIMIIFGKAFEESSSVLRILSGLLFFTFLNRLMMTFLAASDKQSDAARVQWIAVLLNLIGNLILIPVFGVMGAAISTLISEGVFCVLLAITVISERGRSPSRCKDSNCCYSDSDVRCAICFVGPQHHSRLW